MKFSNFTRVLCSSLVILLLTVSEASGKKAFPGHTGVLHEQSVYYDTSQESGQVCNPESEAGTLNKDLPLFKYRPANPADSSPRPVNEGPRQRGTTIYSEGFEPKNVGGELPAGWEIKRNTSADGGLNGNNLVPAVSPFWFRGSIDHLYGDDWEVYVRTGEASLGISWLAEDFTWAITPEIELPEEDLIELSFWMWFNNDDAFISHFYLNLFSDNVWNTLQSWIGEPNNLYETPIIIDLTAYAGKTIKLAFVYEYNDGYEMAIDDIAIDVNSGCPKPTNLYVNNITATQVQVGWINGSTETAWDLTYGQPGFDPVTQGTLISNINYKPYTVSNLQPSTTYHLYVRSVCDLSQVSFWAGPLAFTTFCTEIEKCDYTVVMVDNNGDGWDGTVLGFRQNGWIVGTFGQEFTNGFSYPPVSVPLCPGLQTEIVVVDLGGYTEQKGFSVYDPNGVLVFQRDPGNTFNASTIFFTFISGCAAAVPLNLTVENETVLDGENKCYNAEQTITVGGNGNYFIVNSGGSATLIAGQNIIMLPGVTVHNGAYLQAQITTDGTYCLNQTALVATANEDYEKAIPEANGLINENHPFFHIYPNPTSGTFTLATKSEKGYGTTEVVIYNLMGKKVIGMELPGNGSYIFNITNFESGIYIVRVLCGGKIGIEKLIKQ